MKSIDGLPVLNGGFIGRGAFISGSWDRITCFAVREPAGKQAPFSIAVPPFFEALDGSKSGTRLVALRYKTVVDLLSPWAEMELHLMVEWHTSCARRTGIVKHWIQSWFWPFLSFVLVLFVGKQVSFSSANLLPQVSKVLAMGSILY